MISRKRKAIISEWTKYIELREEELKPLYGATPRFENDQEFLPLQAADLWAWWIPATSAMRPY
jgi:hypothetical protein